MEEKYEELTEEEVDLVKRLIQATYEKNLFVSRKELFEALELKKQGALSF